MLLWNSSSSLSTFFVMYIITFCFYCLVVTIQPCQSLNTNTNTNNNNNIPTFPSTLSSLSRRQVLGTAASTATATATVSAAAWMMIPPQPANAAATTAAKAKGAAELDFEFYMRDLFGGNKKEGTILPSTPPPIAEPRKLQGPLIPLLLNNDCSPSCITVQALIEQILLQSQKKNASPTTADYDRIAIDIQSRVNNLKERTSKSFFAKSPWKEETIMDQYYFDFTSYALWRTAADLLPNYMDRDKFVRRLGKLLYDRLEADQLIITSPNDNNNSNKKMALSGTVTTAKEILQVFQSSNYCKGYKIRGGDDDVDGFVFDELDDESIATGGSVDCLVSIYEPATLSASLQITGEQSRFSPDFVGTTLAALFSKVGVRSSWETFFVDPEYRPNPKDYFPNEQLFQYTLVQA